MTPEQELAEFLAKYPKMLKFQNEIDLMLSKVSNPENRIEVFRHLLLEKTKELEEEFNKLKPLLKENNNG